MFLIFTLRGDVNIIMAFSISNQPPPSCVNNERSLRSKFRNFYAKNLTKGVSFATN